MSVNVSPQHVNHPPNPAVPVCAGDLELDCHPFPHCVIRNFLSSDTFVENLQRELLGLNFHEKSNDLYKFKQVSCQVCDVFSLTCSTGFDWHFCLYIHVLDVPMQSDDLRKRKEPHIAGLR